jgi:hypothetical protein
MERVSPVADRLGETFVSSPMVPLRNGPTILTPVAWRAAGRWRLCMSNIELDEDTAQEVERLMEQIAGALYGESFLCSAVAVCETLCRMIEHADSGHLAFSISEGGKTISLSDPAIH